MCGVGGGSLLAHYSPHQTIRNYSWLLTSDTHPSVQILHHVACPVIYFPWWISTITAHFCLDFAVSQNCFSDWIFKQAICQSAPLNLTYWHQHRQSWSNDSKGERAGGISPQWEAAVRGGDGSKKMIWSDSEPNVYLNFHKTYPEWIFNSHHLFAPIKQNWPWTEGELQKKLAK